MYLNSASALFYSSIGRLTAFFQHSGANPPLARAMAQGMLYQQLLRQSAQLAYLDVIAVLSACAACMIPLIFFMKKHKGGPAAAH